MTLVGIDLNSFSVALCASTEDGPLWAKHTTKVTNRAVMLGSLYCWTVKKIFPGDIVYVEAPVLAGARNIQSTIKVAAAYGAVLAAINEAHATAVEVPVSLWKLAIIGKGNASKTDIASWLHAVHPDHHRECRGDQDLMDATCIALYAEYAERSRTGGGTTVHPAAHAAHP